MPTADAIMPISVVIERREAKNPWGGDLWRPLGVLPPGAAAEPGKILAEGEGWAHYQGGRFDIELFKRETEGYLTNLSQEPPRVFVVLRRNEDAEGPGEQEGLEFEPFMVTVCPYEASKYGEDHDDVVEGVPMPPDVLAWVRDFVTAHHVDTPFVKRKNRRQDDNGGRPPGSPRGLS
jgi:hypothetical protein